MSLEEQLRALDVPRRVLRDVYAPFIVVGPAQFSDTWGAVRQHVGDRLRPHLGQDVFCEADAPVLATEPGVVELATDRLGGTIVRLHRDDGGYWYYAHLSRYASGLSTGDRVDAGDVIGHCGTTGNAAGGSPHVHFGSYPGPENPMDDLIAWLDTAEREAHRAVDRAVDRLGPNVPVEAAAIGTSIDVLAAEQCPTGDEAADPLDVIVAAS